MHRKVPRGPPCEPGGNGLNAGQNDLTRQSAFLQNRFNLTPAEARVVVQVTTGISLKSSAKALGIGYETVRGHLKSAFLKTGTHRQAELLLIVIRVLDEMPRDQICVAGRGPADVAPDVAAFDPSKLF